MRSLATLLILLSLVMFTVGCQPAADSGTDDGTAVETVDPDPDAGAEAPADGEEPADPEAAGEGEAPAETPAE